MSNEGDASTSTASAAQARPQSLQEVYRRRSAFSFPRAAQPEVVRAYQKDVYYRDILQSQLQDVVRSLLGSRILFANAETISFAGSLAYFLLSTLGGAQTLGEEYVNAMMTDGRTGRIVGLKVGQSGFQYGLCSADNSSSPVATICVHCLLRHRAVLVSPGLRCCTAQGDSITRTTITSTAAS
jgi:hypothetical protein